MGLVYGVVKTNKVGSACRFEVCSQECWDAATEEELAQAKKEVEQ